MEKPREELETLVTLNGGRLASVSRYLDYLVIADRNSASSKATKARQLGIKMISEEEFLEMLGG
jgi:DNA ligase (NAD+)